MGNVPFLWHRRIRLAQTSKQLQRFTILLSAVASFHLRYLHEILPIKISADSYTNWAYWPCQCPHSVSVEGTLEYFLVGLKCVGAKVTSFSSMPLERVIFVVKSACTYTYLPALHNHTWTILCILLSSHLARSRESQVSLFGSEERPEERKIIFNHF